MERQPPSDQQWRGNGDLDMDRGIRDINTPMATSTQPPPLLPRPPNSEARGVHRPGAGGEDQAGQQQQEEEESRQVRQRGGGAPASEPEILKILYTNIQSVFSKINELLV